MPYHEMEDKLSSFTKNQSRAINSLKEELEAIDWYQQRIDVVENDDLKKILEHNRDEEKEHAAMLVEWLRRNDKVFEKELKDWIFTDKPFSHE